jgi:DNA processing protein
MDNTQIIALQKLLTDGQIMSLIVTCQHTIGYIPQNAHQWLQMIRIFKEQGMIKRKITLQALQQAISDAQRIVADSMKNEIKIISYYDEDFPEPLKHFTKGGKYLYPLILYYKGNIHNAAIMESIAIIGTRRPTVDGMKMSEYYGNYFSCEGFNIVSGLALGCDTAAHRGALKAGGITTAFVAHGLDIIHPAQNEELAERIIESDGVIISEYPIGTPLSQNNLIERNRLQAGLSDAVILVQTDIKKGGSMHAVNVALENKKPVFAVQFDDKQANANPMSLGNVQLINEKKAVALTPRNVEDVINAIEKN